MRPRTLPVRGRGDADRNTTSSSLSRAMKGNLAYYAGVDRINNAMHNVSVWQSVADANQMATFEHDRAFRKTAIGVHFFWIML